MDGQLDEDALAADQLLQEAIMNDAAHSPREPAASTSNDLAQGAEGDIPAANSLTREASTDPKALSQDGLDLKTDLLQALDGIKSLGSFAACGNPKGITMPDPSIFVRGVGPISSPMNEVQGRTIMKRAYQISSGSDDETVFDASVHNTCELLPHVFEITQPGWDQFLESATLWAAKQLGIRNTVSTQLCSMLLYGEGATLKPNTDTTKTPGVFGTLVICLPSQHEGGDLVLQHHGDTRVFKSSGNQDILACWYSDVTYKVLPVTSGYRWVLTYNLIHPPGIERPSADGLSLFPLRRLLTSWSEARCPEYDHMFYKLQHQYEESNLSLSALIGADRTRVRALESIAAVSGSEILLAFLEKREKEEDAQNCSYPSYGGEDEETESEDEPEVNDTYIMSNLVNLRGRKLISECTFSDEDDCIDRILQGRDSFDLVESEVDFMEDDYDGYHGHDVVYSTYRMTVAIIVHPLFVMNFLADRMDSPPSGALLRYLAKRCCKADTRAAALPTFRIAFQEMLDGYGKGEHSQDAISESLQVALSADVQLFNGFIQKVHEPIPSNTLTFLRKMLQTGHVRFEEVKQSLSSMFPPAQATLSLDERLKTMNALVPSASDLSKSAKEARNWVLEMVAASIEDCRTSCKIGPEGEALVNMVMSYHGFDELYTDLEPIFQRRDTGHTLSLSLSVLSAIAKHISDRNVPDLEGLDTFERLSDLLVERLDIKAMLVAPLAIDKRPAKLARYSHGINHTSALPQVVSGIAVRPEALAGFLDDLIRTQMDVIIMQFCFKVVGQIRDISTEQLEGTWLPFLQSVPAILEAHSIPLSTPRYQCIFGAILDAYLDKAVGKQSPTSEDNLIRPPVSCSRSSCPECVTLNRFLADSSQQKLRIASPNKFATYSGHLHEQFRQLRDCSYRHDGQWPQAWLVTKEPPTVNDQREHWERRGRHAQEEIQKIDQGKLLAVLGDAQFKRITRMSHLRCESPHTPAWVPNIYSNRVLAPGYGDQSVQQPGPIPNTNASDREATAQWQAAPRPPPPAPVAGVKRPVPPDAQVFDLTWLD
ncbi:hypothetical protein VM1G_04457 [Cytospora mali]|uniref:Prolyl 4-hydroxylase alpha subunit Fe(2+) 2OG dioxygenase domain-containing protein n=1 Tax=Cytospora mali TaxID=578113 RepID=A0A194VWH6_CYTMA|nr:hypothetical protein VM1G_04457 [Valsa mali]